MSWIDSFKKLTRTYNFRVYVTITILGAYNRNAKCCIIGKSEEDLKFFEKTLAIGMVNAVTNFLNNEELMTKIESKPGFENKTFIIKVYY